MSFAAPLALLGLILVAALGVGYLLHERRRGRAAVAFAAPALTASVAPRQPEWRRHAPIVLLGLAVASLIVAAAGPQRTVAKPIRRATIMLANDVSNSMTATDVRPSRLAAARRAAGRLVAGVPPTVLVGQLEFARRPEVLQSPTADRALIRDAIARLRPQGGGTAIGEAVRTALRAIAAVPRQGEKRVPGTIVLLSDGHSNVGVSPIAAARQARAEHVAIDTIALGTPGGTIEISHAHRRRVAAVPVSPHELAQIAATAGGRAYRAGTRATALSIYARLATVLASRRRIQPITTMVAAGGLALLVISGALSVVWLGRVA